MRRDPSVSRGGGPSKEDVYVTTHESKHEGEFEILSINIMGHYQEEVVFSTP